MSYMALLSLSTTVHHFNYSMSPSLPGKMPLRELSYPSSDIIQGAANLPSVHLFLFHASLQPPLAFITL
ncbi:hypothetical protein ARMGADRAFT_1018988 [Armillaria gallica]|uniref:Uncharacterized protein n=1 Tax=Armillaria gallica TaxID=47427 RepID=A0A2H3CKM1_ARMGA|nr:hypothetical protein ARMGADRAFT_1018988 [Armillaria gallica]